MNSLKLSESQQEQAQKLRRKLILRHEPNEENLYLWIPSVLGIWLPKHPVCEGHCSPYEYFHDRFFEKHNKTIGWAARSGSKSYMTGLECWLKARYKPGWEAKITGGSLDQSEKAYKATNDFWDATEEIQGRDVLLKAPIMKETVFKNGSMYSISAAGMKSVRGSHQPQNFLDEIDEMDAEVFDALMKQPQTMKGYRANWALTSTLHRVGGLMAYVIDNAESMGFKLYTWCILEVMEPCYDFTCSTCPLAEWCQGNMKPAIKATEKMQRALGVIESKEKAIMGFNPVQDVIDKVMLGETETESGDIEPIDIAADLFCKQPSRSGLVYPEFDANIHVVDNFPKVPEGWHKFRSIDFGYAPNPFVVLYIAVTPRDTVYVYKELYERQKTVPQMAAMMTGSLDREIFERSIADPSDPGAIQQLRDLGIDVVKAKSSLNDIGFVRNALQTRLDGTRSLYICKSCINTIKEFGSYRYPKNAKSDKPEKAHDHAMDALRYFIAAWRRGTIRQHTGIYS